jgi:hypothetical protein
MEFVLFPQFGKVKGDQVSNIGDSESTDSVPYANDLDDHFPAGSDGVPSRLNASTGHELVPRSRLVELGTEILGLDILVV